jgi:hypothetical protein
VDAHWPVAERNGATSRAAQGGPAKGLERTALGRRPFRGVAGTASFKTPRADSPRLAGFPEAVTHAHAWIRVVNGPGPARSLVWSCLRGTGKARPRHAAEAHHLAMLLDRGRGAKEGLLGAGEEGEQRGGSTPVGGG